MDMDLPQVYDKNKKKSKKVEHLVYKLKRRNTHKN